METVKKTFTMTSPSTWELYFVTLIRLLLWYMRLHNLDLFMNYIMFIHTNIPSHYCIIAHIVTSVPPAPGILCFMHLPDARWTADYKALYLAFTASSRGFVLPCIKSIECRSSAIQYGTSALVGSLYHFLLLQLTSSCCFRYLILPHKATQAEQGPRSLRSLRSKKYSRT